MRSISQLQIGCVLVLVVLIAVGISAYRGLAGLDALAEQTRAARSVQLNLVQLFGHVRDAETGQRGFLLTNRTEYLQPYRAALDEIPKTQAQLEALLRSEPTAYDRFTALGPLITTKLDELQATIALANAGQREQALARVGAGVGRQLTDQIRAEIRALEQATQDRLTDQWQERTDNTRTTQWIVVSGFTLASLVVVGLSFFRWGRTTKSANAPLAVRKLTRLYTLALVLLGLLLLSGQIVVQLALSNLQQDARVLNLAGRQRMLSQELTKTVQALANLELPLPRAQYASELRDLLLTWRQTQRGLQDGDVDLGLPGTLSLTNQGQFDQLNQSFQRLYTTALRILNAYETDDAPALAPLMLVVLQTEPSYRMGMDELVRTLEQESRARVVWVRGLELFLLLAALGVLTLEGICIFRPAVQSLLHSTAELQSARDRLQTILNAATDYSIIAADAQGTIELFSMGAERMLGYTAAEMVGKHTPVVIHLPSEIEARSRELSAELGVPITGVGVFVAKVAPGRSEEREWTYVRKDGTHLTVQLSVTAWAGADGATVGYLGVAVDITRRKQAEAELRQAKQAAEEANATKSQFLCNMSHELRTPLNAVIGFANVLHKNKAKNLRPLDLTHIERIASNGRHLLNLINTILDLSKVEAGRMTAELAPCDVRQLVHETLALLHSQVIDKPVELRTELPDMLQPLFTDGGKLKQVLINLVGNALKFTPVGAVVVRVTATTDGAISSIEVSDTGMGIPADKQGQIWEAFQQVDNSDTRQHGGTGLGLTLARSFCTLLGYDLRLASSQVGVGSTFRITLPATAPRIVEATPAPAPTVFVGRPTVLIIDDEADARAVQTHLLDDLSCTVLAAADGPTGLDLARQHRPHLILLDLMMPGMNGWEVLRALKADEVLRCIPVVIASVVAKEHKATLTAAVDHLDKPLARIEMANLLRRHLPGAGGKILIVDSTPTEVDVSDTENLEVRRLTDLQRVLPTLEQFTPNVVLLLAERTTPTQAGQLLTILRGHPQHQQTPVVLVTAQPLAATGASPWPRELAVLMLPPEQNLRSWLQQLLPG